MNFLFLIPYYSETDTLSIYFLKKSWVVTLQLPSPISVSGLIFFYPPANVEALKNKILFISKRPKRPELQPLFKIALL